MFRLTHTRLVLSGLCLACLATPALPRVMDPAAYVEVPRIWPAQIVMPDPDEPTPFIPEISQEVEDENSADEDAREERRRTRSQIGGRRRSAAQDVEEVTAVIVPEVATTPATTLLIERIEEETGICDDVPGPYVVDCLARRFESIARTLPREGDYAVARDALETMSAELDNVVRANRGIIARQETVTIVTPDGTSRGERTRLNAVRDAAVQTARAQAIQVIEEQTTILLRSASEDRADAVHYARIAQAVDSTKLLLRSS